MSPTCAALAFKASSDRTWTATVSLLFAELKGRMPDEKSEKRLGAALDKTIAKIQKNQGVAGWNLGQ